MRCQPMTRRGDRKFELACMFSDIDRKRRELITQFVTWRNLQALRAAAAPRPRARTVAAARTKRPAAKAARRTVARRRTVN